MRRRAAAIGNGFVGLGHGARQSFRGYPFVMAALCALWMGFVLLVEPAAFANAKSFDLMASLAPQPVWGSLLVAVGAANLFAFAWHPRRAWLVALPLLSLFMFIAVTMAYSVGGWTAIGGTYFLIAILSGWAAAERI